MAPKAFGVAVLGILLLTAFVHSPGFANPFLFFDDPQNVVENPAIRALTTHSLKTFFTTPLLGMYSPLVSLSYAIDFRIGALDATVYHATNLALHLLNVVLLGLVARRLSGQSACGAVVALLFGVHPLNVAAVTPLSVRSSLLYSAFYLAAYLAYLSYARHGQRRWFAAALVCFVLAGLSKSAAIVFPVVLLLTDAYTGRRWSRGVWLEKLPFLLVSSGVAVLAVAFRGDLGAGHAFSLIERIGLALYSVAYYGIKLALPVGLSPLHPYPERVDGHLPLMVHIAPLAIVAVVTIAWFWTSRRRLLAFGGLFFLINIALVLKVVPLGVEFMADRYVYLPSIGPLLVAVEIGLAGAPARRRVAVAVFAVVALWFSAASYSRAADWRDRLSFETRVLQQYPDDPDAHAGLGIALAENGRLEEAIGHFMRAATLDPANAATRANLAAAHANLARTLLANGRTADAATELRAALKLADSGSTHYLLGSALAELGQLQEAVAEYESALTDEALARSPELHNDLGVALGRLGRADAAAALFREALRLDPTFEAAKANLQKSGR